VGNHSPYVRITSATPDGGDAESSLILNGSDNPYGTPLMGNSRRAGGEGIRVQVDLQ